MRNIEILYYYLYLVSIIIYYNSHGFELTILYNNITQEGILGVDIGTIINITTSTMKVFVFFIPNFLSTLPILSNRSIL